MKTRYIIIVDEDEEPMCVSKEEPLALFPC